MSEFVSGLPNLNYWYQSWPICSIAVTKCAVLGAGIVLEVKILSLVLTLLFLAFQDNKTTSFSSTLKVEENKVSLFS